MIKLKDILNIILIEEIDPSEAYQSIDSILTIVNNKRNVAFVTEIGSGKENWKKINELITQYNLKILPVKYNPHYAYVIYRQGYEKDAIELKDIAEKYDGYLSSDATKEDTRRIGELLGYKKDKIDQFIIDKYGKL
jgi:hypothetical protein